MENLDSPPPKLKMGKYYVVAPGATSSLIWGMGGLLFHFILSKIAVLDKLNGKPRSPLPQKSKMGKWHVFSFCAASFLIRGWVGGRGGSDGGLLFHFILSKIVDKMVTDNIKVD